MNNIKSFIQYNEGLGSWLKGLITGEKTEDDKIARKILKDVDNIEFRKGPDLYPSISVNRPIDFEYNGYKFSCMYGTCEFYGNDITYHKKIKIESEFLKKLYTIAKNKILQKENEELRKKLEEKRIKKYQELIHFVSKSGGIEDIVFNILKTNFDENKRKNPTKLSSIYDRSSGIRYDRDDNYIYISIDVFNYKGHNDITSVSYNFKDFKLDIRVSYAAYGSYREYDITLDEHHQWHSFFLELKNNVVQWNKINSKDLNNKKNSILSRFK
jgi:hypothetical protein